MLCSKGVMTEYAVNLLEINAATSCNILGRYEDAFMIKFPNDHNRVQRMSLIEEGDDKHVRKKRGQKRGQSTSLM